uniref:Uncharacterized protein n=1 Tax=Schistosoma haematobium TaxID=6185 RepID=A0A095AJH2_SCHHA
MPFRFLRLTFEYLLPNTDISPNDRNLLQTYSDTYLNMKPSSKNNVSIKSTYKEVIETGLTFRKVYDSDERHNLEREIEDLRQKVNDYKILSLKERIQIYESIMREETLE